MCVCVRARVRTRLVSNGQDFALDKYFNYYSISLEWAVAKIAL